MISQEKWKILTHLQNLPKNVEDLGKLIAAKGFKKLPKVQKIAKSGHTGFNTKMLFFNAEMLTKFYLLGYLNLSEGYWAKYKKEIHTLPWCKVTSNLIKTCWKRVTLVTLTKNFHD